MLRDGKLAIPKSTKSSKSRGNWRMGICFEDCQCLTCRRERKERGRKTEESSN